MKLRLSILAALCVPALAVPADALGASSPVSFYLALGDSVAAIDNGYPEQLLTVLKQSQTPRLQLVNLSCEGETTSSMISGYPVTPPTIPGGQHFGPSLSELPPRLPVG